jgi:REP element-mobilizing transposase RayT
MVMARRFTETPYNGETPAHSELLPWEQQSVYFVTFCVERRRAVLANPRAWDISLKVLARLDQWTTLAAIAMPDHWHLLVSPLDREASVSAFSKWFKRWFDEQYCRPSVPDGTRILTWTWQEGCFDRLLRSDESLSDKWEYLRQNPVRAGLVSDPDDWPYQFACTGPTL